MKMLWLVVTGLIIMPGLLFADEKATNTAIAKKNLQSVLPSSCMFSGNFAQQKTITGLEQPLRSIGKVFFACEDGLIWINNKPFKESVIYTKKNFHFRSTESSDFLPLEDPRHELIGMMLINLMSGDVQSILVDFSVHTETARENGEKTKRWLLVPESEFLRKGIAKIIIEKSTATAVNISLVDRFDQSTEITLSNLQTPGRQNAGIITEFCLESLPEDKAACKVLTEPEWQSVRETDFLD